MWWGCRMPSSHAPSSTAAHQSAVRRFCSIASASGDGENVSDGKDTGNGESSRWRTLATSHLLHRSTAARVAASSSLSSSFHHTGDASAGAAGRPMAIASKGNGGQEGVSDAVTTVDTTALVFFWGAARGGEEVDRMGSLFSISLTSPNVSLGDVSGFARTLSVLPLFRVVVGPSAACRVAPCIAVGCSSVVFSFPSMGMAAARSVLRRVTTPVVRRRATTGGEETVGGDTEDAEEDVGRGASTTVFDFPLVFASLSSASLLVRWCMEVDASPS